MSNDNSIDPATVDGQNAVGAGWADAPLNPKQIRSVLRRPVFWLALVVLVAITDLVPVYFLRNLPYDQSESIQRVLLDLWPIPVIAVQAGALALAALRGRHDRPLQLGLWFALFIADVVLPMLGICYFVIALYQAIVDCTAC